MSDLSRVIVPAVLGVAVTLMACQGEPRNAPSRQDGVSGVANPNLRAELLEMARVDEALRDSLTVERLQDSTFAAQMLESQQSHAARMTEIIDQFGWPGSDLVGADGAEAAWLLVQHGGLELQARALHLLSEATEPGVSQQDIAMLSDRVAVGLGRPQRYGTQFSVVDGELVLDSLENPDSVDEWRARVGLGPLADYVEQVRAALGGAVDSVH